MTSMVIGNNARNPRSTFKLVVNCKRRIASARFVSCGEIGASWVLMVVIANISLGCVQSS